jgi:CO/xanthine dehydrogenase Mo-binding subunit
MIGRSVPRQDALSKATGRARYVDDLFPTNVWFGLTVRSPLPCGRIRDISINDAFPRDAAVIVTGAGLGERNRVLMVVSDMPFLATDCVRYAGEPVALVAAPTPELARQAAAAVRVEADPEFAILQLDEAQAAWRGDPQAHPPLVEYRIARGDPEGAMREAAIVLEREYRTPAQEQAYIEPQGVIAYPNGRGVTVEGSLQCPYYVHPALVHLLGCAPEEVIVRQCVTGGAFGGKEDYPSLLAGHAALLAHACGRPVKMIYGRTEDIRYTPKRHPSIVRHRTGLSRDGTLLAMSIEIVLDGGAYATLSPVVLSRAVIHAPGPYACPNVTVHGVVLATNLPPAGAFRGFGVPQVAFAVESHMDELAETCGLRPDQIRRRNLVRIGSTTATGQVLRESVSAERVLDEALARSGFIAKWVAAQRERAAARAGGGEPRRRRGIGLALTWHGGGFTGGGEKKLASRAALTVEDDDSVRIRVASVEMGQGSHTALAQIAAARLGLPIERIACARPDTSEVPNSGPTVASRTVMIVGGLVDDCARQLAEALRAAVSGAGDAAIDFDAALAALRRAGGPLRFESRYELPAWIHWDDATLTGDAYAVFAFACGVAEILVDTATGEVRVERIVSACDPGRAINPAAVEGQIEGGVLQGLGFALLERLTQRDGRFEQDRFQTYIIPTALDAPLIEPILVEEPYSGGPGGAKGVGELPIHAPAPAIANAIAQATGARVRELPITPERLWEALP